MKTFRQRKAKSLARLATKRPEIHIDKDRISQVVHDAVCEYSNTDGYRRCIFHAFGAALLASKATGQNFIVNAGSLLVHADPDRPNDCVAFDAELGGLDQNEFHAWAIGPVPADFKGGPIPSHVSLIDLSARFYRRWVEGTGAYRYQEGMEPLTWRRGEPPDYLWGRSGDLPSWVTFRADQGTTDSVWRHFLRSYDGKDFLNYLMGRWNGLPAIKFIRFGPDDSPDLMKVPCNLEILQ